MNSLIEAENLSKSYARGGSRIDAVIEADVRLAAGEAVALVGPSGSGKSTLLGLLGLALLPTSGRLQVNGAPAPVAERRRARMRNEFFGYLHQDFALIERDSVYANVVIPLQYAAARCTRRRRREKVRNALESVGLDISDRTHVSELSGGERQRIALARALIGAPQVLLADEPTAALDRATADAVLALMLSAREDGRSLVIATHDSRVAAACDRVVEIQDGRVLN